MKLYQTEEIKDPDDITQKYLKRYLLPFTRRICINVIYKDQVYPHSHASNYVTVILLGGYKETLYNIKDGTEETFIRKQGYIGKRKSEEIHKLILNRYPTYTLFFRSKVISKLLNTIVDGKVVSATKLFMKRGQKLKDFYIIGRKP